MNIYTPFAGAGATKRGKKRVSFLPLGAQTRARTGEPRRLASHLLLSRLETPTVLREALHVLATIDDKVGGGRLPGPERLHAIACATTLNAVRANRPENMATLECFPRTGMGRVVGQKRGATARPRSLKPFGRVCQILSRLLSQPSRLTRFWSLSPRLFGRRCSLRCRRRMDSHHL
jgi:hypothetical protein